MSTSKPHKYQITHNETQPEKGITNCLQKDQQVMTGTKTKFELVGINLDPRLDGGWLVGWFIFFDLTHSHNSYNTRS